MTKPATETESVSEHLRDAWERRRPVWTRNDTARWLNDRSALVLAWLRRADPGRAPAYSSSMGRWLQANRPEAFTLSHKKLLQLATDGGEAATNIQLLNILP